MTDRVNITREEWQRFFNFLLDVVPWSPHSDEATGHTY